MNLVARIQAYFHAAQSDHDLDVLPLSAADQLPHQFAWPADDIVTTLLFGCTADTFCPAAAPAGFECIAFDQNSPLALVQEGLDANARGFDPLAPAATAEEAAAFRATLRTNKAFTGRINGVPAAAGMFLPPHHGISEIAGIATLAPFRGQGIGAALVSEIVRSAWAAGVDTVILSTDNPVAERLYRRVGFAPVSWVVSRPAPESQAD